MLGSLFEGKGFELVYKLAKILKKCRFLCLWKYKLFR